MVLQKGLLTDRAVLSVDKQIRTQQGFDLHQQDSNKIAFSLPSTQY
jgi:hypothetical protein